jgi:hypothetical protein
MRNHYLEILFPLLTSPALRAWLRRKRCHPKRGCLRYLPESFDRVLRPLQPRKY